jgi:hypothetical protein
MPALLSLFRPVFLGAPESIVVLVVLLVLFSGLRFPARGAAKNSPARLSRGEWWFLGCLGFVLAVAVGVLFLPAASR